MPPARGSPGVTSCSTLVTLTSLLHDHIALAAQIIADARAGNSTQEASDINAWFANADQIAHFLNSLNPRNWPLAEMQDMMKMHLNLGRAGRKVHQ